MAKRLTASAAIILCSAPAWANTGPAVEDLLAGACIISQAVAAVMLCLGVIMIGRGVAFSRSAKPGAVLSSVALGLIFLSHLGWLKAEELRRRNWDPGRGNLGALRSALSIYYGDMEGEYPSKLESLTISGKYLPSIPRAKALPDHPGSSAVHNGPAPDDSGGWFYNNVPSDTGFGTLMINCTHTDAKGSAWTVY